MHAIAWMTISSPASTVLGKGNDAACQHLRDSQQPFQPGARLPDCNLGEEVVGLYVPVSLIAARVRDAHEPLVSGKRILAVQELNLEPAVVSIALMG